MKVLFLTRYPIEGASSRYRVFQYLSHLRDQGVDCDVQSFMDSDMYALSLQRGRTAAKVLATGRAVLRRLRALRHWRRYDALYLQRELFPFGPALVETWLKRRGAVLFFDYDDALFIKKASRYNPLATLLRSPEKTRTLFRLADCTVAGNNWLRDAARDAGGRAQTIEVAEDTNRIPMRQPDPNAPLTIGWLGSPSTVKYLHDIAPVLQRIARQHPALRWEIMGGGDFRMEGVPWQLTPWSLTGELDALQRFDIGLMPLPAQDWSKGKSGGKARTYMAAGVVPVVAGIGYNLELIRAGETGFLCQTEADWENALTQLIGDAALRAKVAQAARADVEARFAPAGQAAQIASLIRATVEERNALPPAVVLGLSPTGLHVVRSLGRAGVAVTGVAEGMQAGRASRYLVGCISEPDPEKRLESLCAQFAHSAAKPVLIPTSDQDIDWVMQHADRLARHFVFQASYATGLAGQIMEKDSFYALCDTHGVAFPRQWETTRDGLGDLAETVALPCMIKPARIHAIKHLMGGEKGWIAKTPQDVTALVDKIPANAGVLLVQEIVAGPESEITLWCGYRARDGAMQHSFTARKLRQFPPGFGSASLVQSHAEEDSAQIAEQLLKDIGYHGIAAAEFKRAPDGTLKSIEINVRPSLWFSVSEAAGRDVVLAAYRDLAGLPLVPARAQENGVRWRYAAKDAFSARFYRKTRDFVLPAPDTDVVGPARRQIGAVYEPGDIRPVLAEWLTFARKGAGRVVAKLGLRR